MKKQNLFNYKILLFSNSTLSFALGLFTPFWIIFIQDFGKSIESFGFSIGLMVLSSSLATYFAGKYSDKIGRKIFLLLSGFLMTGIIIAYTLINSLIQLYILQVINGLVQAVQMTMETTMLGDYTEKVSRGSNIGKYHAITGALAGIAMMGGGFIIGELGIKTIFYIVASLIFVSTIFIFYIKD
ncbi:MFS transporter [Candidatus Woesearchaeota archaeon]|nr:MFS transporter [Candidatus Woesearchaeota archaeon]